MRPRRWRFGGAAAVVAGGLLLAGVAGCERQGAAQPPPPPAVSVAHPVVREVIEWDEFTGYLQAPEYVEVRARVSGLIEQAPFVEGGLVKKGDLLFVIDPRPYQADFDARQADVQKASAQVELAKLNLSRVEAALPSKAVSAQDYDNALYALHQQQATLASAQAALETSRLNLEWTRVASPISGRISRKLVNVGNLINGGAGQSTLLTNIESVDPVYCYVDVDERSILKYQMLAREKKRVSARDARIPAFLALSDEAGFPHEGVIDFVDNKVDPQTGTLQARGVFPNKDRSLVPGFFGRMRVPGSGRYKATLVPDAAVSTDQNIKIVYVLDADDTVQVRPVKLGAVFADLRSIEQGLSPGDLVIVDGIQHARPGAKVTPQTIEINTSRLTLTAPGSPATQALPQGREPGSTAPSAEPPANAESQPATQPASLGAQP